MHDARARAPRRGPSAIWAATSRTLLHRQRRRLEQLAQRPALDELHGDVDDAVRRADVVDGHDVGMVQGGGGARLRLEAQATIGIGRDRGGQHLDRHLARQPQIARAIDLAHPPGPEWSEDFVLAELRSCRQAQKVTSAKDAITGRGCASRLPRPFTRSAKRIARGPSPTISYDRASIPPTESGNLLRQRRGPSHEARSGTHEHHRVARFYRRAGQALVCGDSRAELDSAARKTM